MSIWKSPVFYFGVVLALVVIAALAAPFVVNWNDYRADLETFGRKISGREVTIGGDIAVKLFPYPQLEARDVSIGNPVGFASVAFVQADVVRVRLSLGGLFNGALNVESVETEKPIINLQRNASGDVNWIFVPEERVAGGGLLSRVKLDQIDVRSGVVSYDDLKAGHSTLFTALNAVLSAQGILGPWRMKGDVRWGDRPFGVSVSTSAKEPNTPININLKLNPHDLALPQAALEGTWNGKAFEGAVRVDPQASGGEKTSGEGTFKPLSLQAKLDVSSERMSLLKIRVAPADRKDSGTLIEGDAVVTFGAQAQARLDLKSPRINLDTLVGAQTLSEWRDGGLLQVANQLIKQMPAKMVADFTLGVSVLTSGGQALNDVRLRGTLQPEAIRVHEFAAELPGRSTSQFNGIVFPGEAAAQLGGKLTFQSQDMRSFLSWLLPNWKTDFTKHWTGNRGQLTVSNSTLDWSTQQLRLGDIAYAFDGVEGRAKLVQQFGAVPQVHIDIDAGSLDVDALVPNGWSVLRDGGMPTLASLITQQDTDKVIEKHVSIHTKSVVLNGVLAENVDVGFLAGPRGFELKVLDIGNVGGAKLSGGGRLIDQGNGPEGDVTFKLTAPDPRGFLRLAGLEYGASTWANALGQTLIEAKVSASPQKSGPEIEITTRGSSGVLNLELLANVRDLEKGRGAAVAATGSLKSENSAALVGLFGLVPAKPVGAGEVTFDLKGSLDNHFILVSQLKALDAAVTFDGTAKPVDPFYGVTGTLTANAKDGRALQLAVGLPFSDAVLQPLDLRLAIITKDGALALNDIVGQALGRRVAGTVEVTAAGRVQSDLETDRMDIDEAMALVFMPWQGPILNSGQNFVDISNSNWVGEVFIRPQQFGTATAEVASEVVVGLGFEKGERRLSISSPGELGLKADVVVKPKGDSFALSGEARWPVALAEHFKTTQGDSLLAGQMLVDGSISAEGRSPAAMLAALDGKGIYSVDQLTLPRLTLRGYTPAILTAKTPEALSKALGQLDQTPGTPFGKHSGTLTATRGEVVFSNIAPTLADVTANIAPYFDLASGEIRVVTMIAIPLRAELPAVTVTYAGQRARMNIRNGSSALAAKLGYELLSAEMARLEKLQQEQQALLAKEAAQRVEDEQRFADYQNTKVELRGQARVRRFHAGGREARNAALQSIVDDAIKFNAVRTRLDLARHARRLAVRRAEAP